MRDGVTKYGVRQGENETYTRDAKSCKVRYVTVNFRLPILSSYLDGQFEGRIERKR